MIYGERIRLRSPERNDIPRFVQWLNDPEIKENMGLYSPLSVFEEEEWFDTLLKRPKDERPFVIEVLDQSNWFAVGNCAFHNIDWRIRSAEIGLFIGEKAFWARGFGTDVIRSLLRYGFLTLNLNRIMLEVYETNLRAIKAYEKVGFVMEGRKRQGMYLSGKYLDVLIMSVLREEWLDQNA